MEERINKPRVFLSHSKKNVDFIENLANDLRKCQIEPWLDTDQIRHGKSWQDSIFESGLPTCDAIIVYFTEMSIQSLVVKKEMDVGLLQNIKDNNIAFLPYVSDASLRSQLRPDIQALQVPEWNETNYSALLPRVVAEIWRSYLERNIDLAIKNERLRRVELELELEKLRNQPDDVFSIAENKEFQFIEDFFHQRINFEVKHERFENGKYVNEFLSQGSFDLLSAVALLSDYFPSEGWSGLRSVLANNTLALLGKNIDQMQGQVSVYGVPDIKIDLLTHGLLEKLAYTTVDEYRSEHINRTYELSKKYFRFKYWLAYHKKLPQSIDVRLEQITNT